MALYISTSGSAGRAGGGGGGGGPRVLPPADGLGIAAGLETGADAVAAGAAALWPGNGRTAGLGLAVDVGLLGPPARKSLPCVIGRTTPAFLLAGGRERLPGGSPEGTWTV